MANSPPDKGQGQSRGPVRGLVRRTASTVAAGARPRPIAFYLALAAAMLVAIAAMNIISGLVMLVKNKGRDIAILRTIGAGQGAILRIFFMAGAGIGVAGSALGLILGILFCVYIQQIQALVEWVTPKVEPGLRACWDALSDLDGATSAVLGLRVPVLLWNGRADPYHDPMQAFASSNGLKFLSTAGDHLGAIVLHGGEGAQGLREFLERA